MRKSFFLKLSLLFSLIFISLLSNVIALASSLPNGINIVDEGGRGVDGLGNYFIENNDIKPGDKFSRTLKISNYPVSSDEEKTTFNISLKMKPINQEGKADLFNNISLKLSSNGKEIYNGNIIGEDSSGSVYQDNPLFITSVAPGEVKELVADFTASDTLPTDYWVEEFSWADFAWQFVAVDEVVPLPSSSQPEPTPSDSSTPPSELPKTGKSSSSAPSLKLPQTGEEWAVTLLGLAVGIIIITFVLVIVKRMRENKDE